MDTIYKKILIGAYLTICITGITATFPPPERLTGMNPCISKQTCHECIQTPHCAWCAAPVSIVIHIILYDGKKKKINFYLNFSFVFII